MSDGSPYVQQTRKGYTIFITGAALAYCFFSIFITCCHSAVFVPQVQINASIPDLPYSPTPASSAANVSSIFDTMLTHEPSRRK